jgi:hypothetical protein
MLDREPLELRDHLLGTLAKFNQPWTLDLVLASNLLHHELGVRNYLQRLTLVHERVVECGQQSVVLCVVVGLVPQVLAQGRDFVPGLIGDDDPIARRARISPRPAVHVRDQV